MRQDMLHLMYDRRDKNSSHRSDRVDRKKLNPNLDYFDGADWGDSKVIESRWKSGRTYTTRPLENFLNGSVGRVWDEVYSEIRRGYPILHYFKVFEIHG